MELYWEQRKVYLYGQLAFLPKAIEGKTLSAAKLRHYFDIDNLQSELQAYEKDNYFSVTNPNNETFVLTNINSQKFHDELGKYIKAYRTGKLTTGNATKPSFEKLQQKLWDVASRQYAQHGYRPIIKWQDIYSPSVGYGYSPPFWEIIFAPALAKQVELINMSYTKTTAEVPDIMLPLYEKPFVELEVVDEKIKQTIQAIHERPRTTNKLADSSTASSAISPRITLRSYDTATGTLFFGSHEIQIIRQKKRQGSAVGETIQGGAIRKLFKDVNTLRDGVPLHAIVSVRKDNFDKQKRKRATNHLDEINRKVQEETGVPKLIVYDAVNYYVAKSYL